MRKILVFGLINFIVIIFVFIFMAKHYNKVIYNSDEISFNIINDNNIEERHEDMFFYNQAVMDSLSDGYWANVNTREAVLIAHLIVFNNNRDLEVEQPYNVYFDEYNEVYTVLGYSIRGEKNPIGVVICKKTGGILSITEYLNGSIPLID